MKIKNLVVIAYCLVVLVAVGCGQKNEDGHGEVVARVNDYQMGLNDFNRQLKAELELTPEVKLNATVRKTFLEELIRKELMIQEAKKLGLDTEPDFVRTIERYWEATLIRKLLEKKSREIEGRMMVAEEEILAHYRTLKGVNPDLPPLAQMHSQLFNLLKEKKKTDQLQDWVNGLWEKSRIEIDENLLAPKPPSVDAVK